MPHVRETPKSVRCLAILMDGSASRKSIVFHQVSDIAASGRLLLTRIAGGDSGVAVWRLPACGRVPRGSPAAPFFRSFLIRSLRYLNGGTLPPFPTEAGQRDHVRPFRKTSTRRESLYLIPRTAVRRGIVNRRDVLSLLELSTGPTRN